MRLLTPRKPLPSPIRVAQKQNLAEVTQWDFQHQNQARAPP